MKPDYIHNFSRIVSGHGLLCVIVLLAGMLHLAAHVGTPPLSLQQKSLAIISGQELILPTTDVAAELASDLAKGNPTPLRFAVPQPVEVTPATHGSWTQLPEGRLWRLRVVSTNATDLNFGFSTFWLPEGATLHILSDDGSYYQGPYTAGDTGPKGELWTPVVPGEAAIIELFVPAQATESPRLVLSQIATGYRDFFRPLKTTSPAKAEGTCNNDVVCPAGVPWANEIRSVGRYTISGAYLCTGSLVANTAGDFRPYFLTANHCGLNNDTAGTVVVYWNYQSTNCGTHGPGSLAQNQSGAIFRASKYDVDFSLIELSRVPSLSYNVYYSGWDRSGTAPTGAVGIHHPAGDVKAISFATNTLATISSCIGTGGANTHWYAQWGSGVTEGGSSGSGLWGSTSHQIVGTLSGGNSVCGGADLTDCYGKLSVAWASGTSSVDRLRDWLDPQNSGVTSLVGATAVAVSLVTGTTAALVAEGCTATNGVVDPGEAVTVSFSLKNVGTLATTNLVATLLTSNGVTYPSAAQTYGALSTNGTAVARSFTFVANGACGGTITPMFQLQDGPRNLGTATFSLSMGAPNPSFATNFDGVTAPTLPSGWTSSPAGIWVTTTAQRDTLPNSVFAPDVSTVTDYQLTSPPIPIAVTNAQLTFRHYYNTESSYDGGALEISIKGGAFADIVTAGGSFASGGYNGSIDPGYSNPLAGRSAWTGNSGGFVTTVVNLPATAAGGNIQLRWRLGNDSIQAATGWYVDTMTISSGYLCCTGLPAVSLAGVGRNPSQQFQFNVSGGTGYPYAILVSTNLRAPMSNWTVLTTNTTPFTFTDSNSPGIPQRFYRAQPK